MTTSKEFTKEKLYENKPKQLYLFQEKKETTKVNHTLFLPIFSDQKINDIQALLKIDNFSQIWEKKKSLGNFEAKKKQIDNFDSIGTLLLGGLGKQEEWDPEDFCELFRNLGAQLASYNDLSLEIFFTQALHDTWKSYRNKKIGNIELSLHTSKIAKTKEKKEASLDFIGKLTEKDLIFQCIVNMNIGAEKMKVFQKTEKAFSPISVSFSFEKEAWSSLSLDSTLEEATSLSELIHYSRYIASLPGNFLNPKSYEYYVRSLAKEYKLKCQVFQLSDLERLGMGGIIAVGKGSDIQPRAIVLEYKPTSSKIQKPLVLVGKGITFDTGGISLKPPPEMHEMKYDMCGSALALHGIAIASKLKLDIPVIALLGLAENMPSSKAIKPGDVYTAFDGTSVEVQNTDAEGRLVLGDLLAYAAKNYDPLCLLDFATLTGACIIALGHEASAVMTASDPLYTLLEEASKRSLDRIWRLPHWPIYGKGLKSEVADQRNIAGRAAGTVSAMRFLARFVPSHIPWAHLDIAGTAWRSSAQGSQTKGATAWGLRLLHAFMEDLSHKSHKT